ncbi:MAG: amidohydrolase family protein [Acutalibacteraceae bacterium]
MLFGSDSPWVSQKKFVRTFDSLPFTAEEKQAILCNNAKALLGI